MLDLSSSMLVSVLVGALVGSLVGGLVPTKYEFRKRNIGLSEGKNLAWGQFSQTVIFGIGASLIALIISLLVIFFVLFAFGIEHKDRNGEYFGISALAGACIGKVARYFYWKYR